MCQYTLVITEVGFYIYEVVLPFSSPGYRHMAQASYIQHVPLVEHSLLSVQSETQPSPGGVRQISGTVKMQNVKAKIM